jgi:hypothetical protein
MSIASQKYDAIDSVVENKIDDLILFVLSRLPRVD